MGSKSKVNLSLLAQYDDLCRHTAVLSTSGFEKEFRKYVDNEKHFHQRIKGLESENKDLNRKISVLEKDKLRSETQYKHARGLLISLEEKFRKLEQEKISLERRVALIKELITDKPGLDNKTIEQVFKLSSTHNQENELFSRLSTINEKSNFLLSSSDCDETNDDDLDTHKSRCKRDSRNKSPKGPCEKRQSKENLQYLTVDEDVFSVQEEIIPRKSFVSFRSSSEPTSTTPEEQIPRKIFRSESEQIKEPDITSKRSSFVQGRTSLPVGRYSSGGKLSRPHAFVTKTFIRSEKCNPCGKIIKFCKQALKCTDCRINCHSECKDQCPLPCIPVVTTLVRGPPGTISAFVTSTSPMIPSLIVHCINEIESRGFQDIGLYRVNGSERAVKDLKDKFLKGKTVPTLNEIDVHVICGTVKEFLRSLKDSLIPKSTWYIFTVAASNSDESTRLNSLSNAVCELPQPNRETLAFLILHLLRVAASPMSKMPIRNLSKVFGPTIVGYSVEDPTNSTVLKEIKQQTLVMESLLQISTDFWENLLNCEVNSYNVKLKTPEFLPAPLTSRLGPIHSSKQKFKAVSILRTNLSPRTRTDRNDGTEKRNFLAPLLK